MTKIKVIDLDDLYNSVVADFFIWNHCVSQNSIWGCNILKFKFRMVQTKSDRELNIIKAIDLDKLYNFFVDDLFNWNNLLFQNYFQRLFYKF